jgi:monoamine oxidase
MARSKLIISLHRACEIAQMHIRTGIPADELVEILPRKTTRRRFIYGGLGLATTAAVSAWYGDSAVLAAESKVLVVGAGIAGLTAAYRLRQFGVSVDIVEARNRVGGRMYTARNVGGTSLYADIGGEFIDTTHTSLRSLAKELGLQTVDLYAADQGLVGETNYYQGRKIKESEIAQWSIPLIKKIKQDLATLGNQPVTYRSKNPVAMKLDNISIAEYLERSQIHPILNQMLQDGYTTLYGRDAAEQSCLSMLLFIGTDGGVNLSSDSDERYQIKGGNDQVPSLLAKSLANVIQTETELEAINMTANGRYRVSLHSGNGSFEKIYERILLAIPYTTLRAIALNVNLPPVKEKAISELGYGTNSKLVTAYKQRLWVTRYKSTAFISTDLDFNSTWESTRNHQGKFGLITNFTGGKQGFAIGQNSGEYQAQILLLQLEKIFPGISQERQGEAVRAYWTGEQYTQGSYSCYLTGQWTGISGVEKQTVGNLFFAGEHCSQKVQGYMEGGCRTGEVAAVNILRSLGLKNNAAKLEAQIKQRSRQVNQKGHFLDEFSNLS